MTLVQDMLRHSVKVRGEHPAVVAEQGTLSYRQLERRVRQFASALQGEGDIGRESRFALLSRNRSEFVEILLGAAAAGRPCVPLSYRLAAPEIAEILADSESRLLVVEREFDAVVEAVQAAGYSGRVIWFDGSDEDSYERLLERSKPEPLDMYAADAEVALQIYTSGTTGVPKGVMLSHRNLMGNTWSHLAERSAVPSDRYLSTAPLCHLGAASRVFLLAHAGATHVIHRSFEADRVVAAIEHEGVDSALVVPAMVRQLLEAVESRGVDVRGRVRLFTYGTAPMPVDLLVEALERFGCDFQQGYGLTEAGPNLTLLRPSDHRPGPDGAYDQERLGSVGQETTGVHVRIVDRDDQDVEVGEVGEVIARGPNIMEGYWRRPEDSAEALRDGWLRTGDLGRHDAHGYVHLVDRSKDMLVSGGFNVYPREVERQLERHPAVADTAVVGVPDRRWGEVPVAFVVPSGKDSDPGALSESLRAFLETRLARYKVPRRYEFVDVLPRNAVGKVLKRELKATASTRSSALEESR